MLTKRFLVIEQSKEANRADWLQDIIYDITIIGVFKTKKAAEDFMGSSEYKLYKLEIQEILWEE